jgi:hypothetical protein
MRSNAGIGHGSDGGAGGRNLEHRRRRPQYRKFSPEVMEAEWLDGATGPSLGARFRGHVRRNEIGPVY